MTLKELEAVLNTAVEDAIDLGEEPSGCILKLLREEGLLDESTLDPEEEEEEESEKEAFRRARADDDGVFYEGDDEED